MAGAILAVQEWNSNADLIHDCAALGYIYGSVLDCTYGYGTFWKMWEPEGLVATDSDPAKARDMVADFRSLPFADGSFNCVVFDPPYKLNGTPSAVDERYGVHAVDTREGRMSLIADGLMECARVLGDGFLLLKCQDQVNGGKVRWQTDDFTNHARSLGLGKVDRFDHLSYRPQPNGRRQVHARRNSSQLLVFKRGWKS